MAKICSWSSHMSDFCCFCSIPPTFLSPENKDSILELHMRNDKKEKWTLVTAAYGCPPSGHHVYGCA